VTWLRKAAEAGEVSAQYNLSRAYRLGIGVKPDQAQQLYWVRKAAEAGSPSGMNGLGYSILIGLDGTYDFVEACAWLILAVERSGAGELHDRAVVNLDNARAQLNDAEQAEAEARAAHWRAVFGVPAAMR